MKKEHLENLIAMAEKIRRKGAEEMDYKAFDTKKLKEYEAEARAAWGDTEAYREYERKSAGRTEEETGTLGLDMMALFREFGEMKTGSPEEEAVQAQVKKLRDFITAHYYTCTDEILAGLGQMYAADGAFRDNIDRAGGEGTAEFVGRAIAVFCGR